MQKIKHKGVVFHPYRGIINKNETQECEKPKKGKKEFRPLFHFSKNYRFHVGNEFPGYVGEGHDEGAVGGVGGVGGGGDRGREGEGDLVTLAQ